jgi:Flp pilus assembly protein TadG
MQPTSLSRRWLSCWGDESLWIEYGREDAVETDRPVDCAHVARATAQRLQRGAYALEFALVFPVFFVLFYGVLSFGLIFTVQQSLTLAAEDGARASLRYFQPAGGGFSTEQQLLGQLEHGCDVAKERASWLASSGTAGGVAPVCSAAIQGPCRAADGSIDTSQRCSIALGGGGGAGSVACGTALAEQCSVSVTVSYAYGANPLAPSLPGTALLIPDTIRGAASVTIDPAVLRLAAGGGGA